MRNKFPGLCKDCGTTVPAGKGHPHREDGRFKVRCISCVAEGRKEKEAKATF